MSVLEILLLALGLSMDAFAVAVASMSQVAGGVRASVRLSFHFGLFQFLMPIVGWLAGHAVAGRIARVDHWIAFALLALVGLRMIRSGLERDPAPTRPDPSRGVSLVVLSVATSIDALAVGLSLGVMKIGVLYPSAIIGLVTFALSLVGAAFGRRLGILVGRRMEAVGGMVLVVLGARILWMHMRG